MRAVEVDELKLVNAQVERTKSLAFGISYFVVDPEHCKKLRDSVVSVTMDGTGYTQHFRNVFRDTSSDMRVIQVKYDLYQFVPDGMMEQVVVRQYENIDRPEEMKMTALSPLKSYLDSFSLAQVCSKSIILIGGHDGRAPKGECLAFNKVKGHWDDKF